MVAVGLAAALVPPAQAAPRPGVIVGFVYAPGQGTNVVAAGDVVSWTNLDPFPHTVTAIDETFESPTLSTGAAFELDTTGFAPGVYDYFCQIHPFMGGSLAVV